MNLERLVTCFVGYNRVELCLALFYSNRDNLTDQHYWGLVREFWVNYGACSIRQFDMWIDLWSGRYDSRELIMSPAEREAFAAMPDELRIYRGVNVPVEDALYGFSWSLDYDVAHKFAEYGLLGTVTIPKSSALAYLTGANQHEIVVLPSSLPAGLIRIKSIIPDNRPPISSFDLPALADRVFAELT